VNDELASRIRQARKDAGLSREQLAITLGVSLSTVVRWETGRANSITLERVQSIGQVTGRELSFFLDGIAA
jgi:transcriptional regulator with XRE-family HTH domain